ncbi:cbb3-type cytochrome c oxidase subunit I [Oscillatoria amoena NRMC-F 0135]|nr:cbb3-type cytochrome c oxidase subunit I [Oscillatoria amoena NRMC-F 0135]
MSQVEKFNYDNRIVRNFIIATVVFGIVGMTVGLLIAFQLVTPNLNLTQYGTFGRIRPLHTNAVIFAFVGNAILQGCTTRCNDCLKPVCLAMHLATYTFGVGN